MILCRHRAVHTKTKDTNHCTMLSQRPEARLSLHWHQRIRITSFKKTLKHQGTWSGRKPTSLAGPGTGSAIISSFQCAPCPGGTAFFTDPLTMLNQRMRHICRKYGSTATIDHKCVCADVSSDTTVVVTKGHHHVSLNLSMQGMCMMPFSA